MKILFVCGATIANDELKCASWIRSIITNIDSEYEIAIASTSPTVTFDSLKESTFVECIKIQIFPLWLSDSFKKLSNQLKQANFEVIIIFGTENPIHLTILKACQYANLLDKTVVFAQGLCCVCAQHYAEGVPERVIKRYTFRDLLRRQNIAKERKSLAERAEIEKETLRLTHHFIGRTTMDKAILRKYNQTAEYHKCNDVLRNVFYEGQWKYSDCEKHRIFISQYYYPLKGFHYLLDAVVQLKKKYPDVKIAAAGYNPVKKSLIQKELKDGSYIRYIKSLVKKYQLQKHIELLGELSEERMKEEYLKANVFVMPSTIENSPNSLAEAMMLGVPTVASDVGGVTDFAAHKTESYIYPSSATYLLAHYIDEVFSSGEGAQAIGSLGKKRAELEYDKRRNILTFEETMKRIAGT